MGRRFVAARINVLLARTPENMRTNYVWTDDPRAVELNHGIGWLAFSWDCITCTGLELLAVMAQSGSAPQIGFEIFDRDPSKLKAMVDYAVANFPPSTFITQSADGGETWDVVQ